jgi:SH3-like domain-containing protein
MTTFPRSLIALLALSFLPIPTAVAAPQEAEVRADDLHAGRTALHYVRVREGGVTVRNIWDVQGVPLLDLPAGTLLAVYGERSGWLEVEAPGGFPVWVFGRLLTQTDREAVFEVTHNNVNLRPKPDPGPASFPLDRQLQAGDLVTAIELPADVAALDDTWVRIWTPPGVGAWVQASRTEAVGDGEDGALAWRQAEAALFELASNNESQIATAAPPTAASADRTGTDRITVREASGRVDGRALEALAGARELLEEQRRSVVPDYGAVEEALRGVLALGPGPSTRQAVSQELDKLALLRSLAQVEARLAERERREREALLDLQAEQWGTTEAAFVPGRAFAERGVVEGFRTASGAEALRLSRGGRVVAELDCAAGRYELSLFVGAEVSLTGSVAGRAALHDGVPSVEVGRLEVLAAPRR